jgi:predicted RNA-binding protein YlqC (UPF0109 family)
MAYQLITYVVKSLVSNPQAVSVQENEVGGRRVVQVRVSSQDIARVIGSGGRTFRALRALALPVLPADIKDIVIDVAE